MIWSSSSAPLAQQRRQDIAKMPMAKVRGASIGDWFCGALVAAVFIVGAVM